MTRARLFTALALAAVLMTGVIGCGDGDDGGGSSSTDVDTLLSETFSGSKKVESGRLDVRLDVDIPAGGGGVSGPVDLKLSGPFESDDDGGLPELDLDVSFSGAGQEIAAGLTVTDDAAFVAFQGQDYVVGDKIFDQLRTGWEQSRKQANGSSALGLDPRAWLTNARVAGEQKVGDADTIKITGTADVAKLLDDVSAGLERLRGLQVDGAGSLPEPLTDQDKREITKALGDVKVELYTGKQDRILRRLVVALDLEAPGQSQAGKLRLDLGVTDLNEDQDIDDPKNAKPLDKLLSQLGPLGLGLSGADSPSRGGSTAGDGAAQERLEDYSGCINRAAGEVAKSRKCAELLKP